MIIPIESPNELPHGIYLHMYQVEDQTEAEKIIANNQKGYLFQSHTIKALYLFVPVTE